MELSIICPTLNEISFIDQVVADLCANDGLSKEVLIVDGGSTDGTPERVRELSNQYSNLRLIHNPRKTSTAAFNIGTENNQSDYIAFVGAHARYSPNYFSYGIKRLKNGDCDAIGGLLKQDGKTIRGRAIALAMSTRLGVGNTAFRVSGHEQYVDSVAFAIYSRKAVLAAGPMDETLPVNQDDEYHYRLNSMGFKMLMTDQTQAVYFVRDTYQGLFRQYFRYGEYKPAVLKRVKGSVKLRHIVPSLFVTYFACTPLGIFFPIVLCPALCYLLLICIFSVLITKGKMKLALACLPVFPILHFAYGSGFIKGMLKGN